MEVGGQGSRLHLSVGFAEVTISKTISWWRKCMDSALVVLIVLLIPMIHVIE